VTKICGSTSLTVNGRWRCDSAIPVHPEPHCELSETQAFTLNGLAIPVHPELHRELSGVQPFTLDGSAIPIHPVRSRGARLWTAIELDGIKYRSAS
jgi:hypothetical protein